jgi:hypothetical protein
MRGMKRNKILLAALVVVTLLIAVIIGYRHWSKQDSLTPRERMLSLMPADASAVVFLDMADLRATPFFAKLFEWAPKPSPDSDYTQFLKSTGFNYETDLDRLALSIHRQSPAFLAFAVAEGRFDRKKIEAYGSQFGMLKTADGKTLFAVPLNESRRKVYFTFLSDDRIAWANDSSYFFQRLGSGSHEQWRDRFVRLAGTPVFAVLRQDSGAAEALAQQAPGGLHSPQLATLLAQLDWISISAKPDGNMLRVGMEGECVAESTEHQLKDLLSGLVVLAQIGLNDPKTQKKLDPALREGYAELLQSAEIQQVDRGTSKSVRVVFDVTPKLLEAAENGATATDPVKAGH